MVHWTLNKKFKFKNQSMLFEMQFKLVNWFCWYGIGQSTLIFENVEYRKYSRIKNEKKKKIYFDKFCTFDRTLVNQPATPRYNKTALLRPII
jgi:hypothetical protein